jgi:hypothetical protein
MAYRKRAFLNPISTGQPSFVFAVADSSEGGKKEYGDYVLTIADCKRISNSIFLSPAHESVNRA